MGRCPAWGGTNVPNIRRVLSSTFIEQLKSKNAPKKGMSQKSFNVINTENDGSCFPTSFFHNLVWILLIYLKIPCKGFSRVLQKMLAQF